MQSWYSDGALLPPSELGITVIVHIALGIYQKSRGRVNRLTISTPCCRKKAHKMKATFLSESSFSKKSTQTILHKEENRESRMDDITNHYIKVMLERYSLA